MSAPSTAYSPGPDDRPPALQAAVQFAIDKQARMPTLLRVTDIVGYTDWILVLSGRSERHVAGIVDGIVQGLRGMGIRPRGADGLDQGNWALLDYDDFIIHVFHHPTRLFYDLESMLRDAPRVPLDVPPELADASDLETINPPGDLPAFQGDFAYGGFVDEFGHDDDAETDVDVDEGYEDHRV